MAVGDMIRGHKHEARAGQTGRNQLPPAQSASLPPQTSVVMPTFSRASTFPRAIVDGRAFAAPKRLRPPWRNKPGHDDNEVAPLSETEMLDHIRYDEDNDSKGNELLLRRHRVYPATKIAQLVTSSFGV
ncbi:MAG: hypothetical protein H7312_07520 [Tardiphaga sp.]|nr:hypothetical protein [Tardiphaga sp.]